MPPIPKRSKSHVARQPVSTRRRAQRIQTIILIVLGAAVAASLGALAYSYLTERVLPLQEPVARVTLADGPPLEIRRGEFYNRVRFERSRYIALAKSDAEISAQLADTYGFGQMVLERMMHEALVRAEAARRGLTVSEAEITQYVEEAYGLVRVTPTPTDDPWRPAGPLAPVTPAPTPILAPTEAAYLKSYRADLKTWTGYGITEAAFREIVRAHLLEIKLRQAMQDEAFDAWLESLEMYMTWLDGWEKDIPKEPAWP